MLDVDTELCHTVWKSLRKQVWSQTDLPTILLNYFGVYDLEQNLYAPQTSLLSSSRMWVIVRQGCGEFKLINTRVFNIVLVT